MCTTVIVGEKASFDGSFLMARSADSSALKAQHFVIHPAKEYPEGAMYRTKDYDGATDFSYPLPRQAMRYTTVPNWKTGLHGAVGFNSEGLGITGTESIFARDDALAIDPYNKESGITEDDILDVLLPRCKTAREAVALLGKIIETQGAGEGFGVGFADDKEVWYLETGTGHQWMAQRTPAEVYFASGNQGRLRFFDPKDDTMMGSPTLISFAEEHGFYDPKSGKFDFAAAYTRNDDRDRIYNDPRVWVMQKILNPSLEQKVADGRNFDVYLKPEQPVTLQNLKDIMRNHFEGYAHDPYSFGLNGSEPWRPISVFRTYEAHILQVRPWMPREIGDVIYVAFGMACLSCFMPFYQGLDQVPAAFGEGTDHADDKSIYWKFRKLQTLAMTDFPTLAPIVQKKFAEHEAAMSEKQSAMEKEYTSLYATDMQAAHDLLQKFNLEVFAETEEVIDGLMNELFTVLTTKIEKENFFANKKMKD